MSDIAKPLLNTLKNLPNDPGIYRMLDTEKVVLYVGKASNLKKRVNSYFSKQNQSIKTKSLVSQIAAIEIHITNTETEALLLESNLIKSLRPKYNVLMRDDKSYPYIEITSKHDFPSIQVKRSKKRPTRNNDFFGPYPSIIAIRETMNIISKIFKLRTCSDSYFNSRSRPCLQYQIGRCTAPCTDYISKDAYKTDVLNTRKFLRGEASKILEDLSHRMQIAADNLEFEKAGLIRDQIKSLRLIQESQGVIKADGDADVIVINASLSFACTVLVRVRNGEVLSCESFFPKMPEISFTLETEQIWQQVFNTFIAFYYLDSPQRIPNQILINQNLADKTSLEEMLSSLASHKCRIKKPVRGVQLGFIEFALNNLSLEVSRHNNSVKFMQSRFQDLAKHLAIPEITRLECFDISHTQGSATIASCVVFDKNGPLKKDYRRFNINNITKGDDYAAMHSAILRRYSKPQELPTVLIIDGGKGQVGVAKKVLAELGLNSIVILGVAKGRTRKAGLERLFLGATNQEFTLAEDSAALHLIQHIRDESHRFAITAHRNKRQKQSLHSSLEDIEGVGAKRRQALLRRFGGIKEITKAPVAELVKVNGISKSLAERIYSFFH